MAQARVLLLGDSARVAIQGRLARLLTEDGLEVVGPTASCGGAPALAEGAAAWAEEFKPDIACFGCGPWATEDLLRVVTAGGPEVAAFEPLPLGDFERALMDTVMVLQRWCGRQVVYYTTPPVHPARVSQFSGSADFGHHVNRWIAEYNQLATELLGTLNVGHGDVFHDLSPHDESGLAADGITLTPEGVEIAARVMSKAIYGLVHP